MYWHDGGNMIWMLVFWAGVIVAGALGLRYALGSSRGGPAGESPEAILKRRYARGEIDRDEFESRLSDLRK
jgi:putative membrane protein